jgi:hypothetical protein
MMSVVLFLPPANITRVTNAAASSSIFTAVGKEKKRLTVICSGLHIAKKPISEILFILES